MVLLQMAIMARDQTDQYWATTTYCGPLVTIPPSGAYVGAGEFNLHSAHSALSVCGGQRGGVCAVAVSLLKIQGACGAGHTVGE